VLEQIPLDPDKYISEIYLGGIINNEWECFASDANGKSESGPKHKIFKLLFNFQNHFKFLTTAV
jgi:hypothetical protein